VSVSAGGLTGAGQRQHHLQGLQQQLGVVGELLQRRQNHEVVLVLHELHQVGVAHWEETQGR